MRLPLFVARIAFQITHVFCGRAFGWFVCACMLDVRAIEYAFAFVCCHVAFHITRVCRLHVCFVFVPLVCLFVFV